MALITGLLLVFALGLLHYLGLMAIRQGAPGARTGRTCRS